MLEDLEWRPKDYPTKSGPLSEARADHIEYRGASWRAIFLVDDDFAEVALIAFGPRDTAYAQAERRI
jgi:hypothetical protein